MRIPTIFETIILPALSLITAWYLNPWGACALIMKTTITAAKSK
jgi:hypothetical protein